MSLDVPRVFYWIMGVFCVGIILLLTQTSFFHHEKAADIKEGVEIIDVNSFWTAKSSSVGEVTMVPAVSFKIRNKRSTPLEYVQVNGVFHFVSETQNLGDAFTYPIQGKPLRPGETTDPVLLKSNFGYRASSKTAFLDNPGFKQVEVKLFAQSRASGPVLVGTYLISKRLTGVPATPQTQPNVLPLTVN